MWATEFVDRRGRSAPTLDRVCFPLLLATPAPKLFIRVQVKRGFAVSLRVHD